MSSKDDSPSNKVPRIRPFDFPMVGPEAYARKLKKLVTTLKAETIFGLIPVFANNLPAGAKKASYRDLNFFEVEDFFNRNTRLVDSKDTYIIFSTNQR